MEFQNVGASSAITFDTTRLMDGVISGASASANSTGTIFPNISFTSSSFVVIRSHKIAAILPALLGMIPCHPPSRPNGWPSSCANLSRDGVNSSG